VSQGTEEAETITLDELFGRMQQDPNLVQLLAQQVGIETTDPQVIINAIINQFNASNQVATNEAGDWFNQGVQQDQSEDFEGAIASYNQALEIQPDLYEAWFNKGNVFAKLGRFEEAITAYDKAIEFQPNLHEAWHNRGNVLSNLGRLDEANASFNKAQEIKES
jgi:tetratricopeptide (TPR) repeat protein